MKTASRFLSTITSLLFLAAMSIGISMVTAFSPAVVFAGLLAVSIFIPMPKGVAMMALQKEIWAQDIVANLFKNNAFATRSMNHDTFVLNGKVVHLPIAGAPAQTKRNLNAFPQTAVNRSDDELTYALDTYYSLPRQIQNIEQYELSYDKRQSVVGEDQRNLTQEAMNGLLIRWAPEAAGVIETTGAGTSEDVIDEVATGQRKTFTKDELKNVAKKFATRDENDRPVALLTAAHYHQFFDSLSDAEKTNFNSVADLANGIVGRYMGIDIMMRSSVLRYRKVAGVWTVVDTQADAFAAAAADSAASLFWTQSAVCRAVGEVTVFEDNNNPLYYGDLFSALVRMGGRIRRTSGVIAVVEAAV